MTREEERALLKHGVMDPEFVRCFARLVAKGVIYDTGERRDGQIAWSLTPGKEDQRT
jgi:hypothetical protein